MDTASALQNTYQRLASCAKYLLNCGVSYVLLGHMQSDALEKQFGKYQQGSGGTYLITVQNVIQKFKIDKTRKLLDKQIDLTILPPANHHCDKCELDVEFDVSICENCDDQLPNECKQGLTYIAGFIAFKLPELHSTLEETDTFDIFQKYGALISSLSRGRLKEPSDNLVYFVIYCFFIFEVIQVDKVSPPLCKRGLIDFFINCNSKFKLLSRSVKKASCILANIFLNNYCKKHSEGSGKECLIKQAKLSTSK
jgi:hypothetical protein